MKRRDFLKITMGAFGSAMGIAVAKADVLQGVSQEMPKPAEPVTFGPCSATHGTPTEFSGVIDSDILKAISEMQRTLDNADVPITGRFVAIDGYIHGQS